MSKIIQIKIFNDIFDQLLEYLETNFSLFKSDILLAKTGLQFLRSSNPMMVVDQFTSYVIPYKKYILDCDEDFFINFDKNLKDIGLRQEDMILGNKIRYIWCSPDISEIQKAHIWMYFHKLIKAAERIH